MRKYILTTLVLACIAAGGILWAYGVINGQQDDIAIKETIEAGSSEATKGIKVSTKVLDPTYGLNWNTDMFLDGSGNLQSRTDFQYDRLHKESLHESAEDRHMVTERFCYDLAHLNKEDLESKEELIMGTLLPMELAKNAWLAAGDRKEFIWHGCLDDYMEYFPICIYTDCPSYDHPILNTTSDVHDQRIDWSSYFQFPIPKDFPYQVKIRKDRVDGLSEFTMMTGNEDEASYAVDSDGFWDGDRLYLAVSTMEEVGSGEIFVECPDEKRGIHIFPTEGEPVYYIDFEKAEMVYPIASGIKVINLTQSEDGRTLYLLTKDQSGLTVDVIDKASMKCRQKLQLTESFAHTASYEVSKAGKDWVFYAFDRKFVLITEQNGVYEEVMADTVGGLFNGAYIDCDYNGDRLAIVTTEWDSDVIETQLRVFDKDGCLYRGRFDYSNAQYYYDEKGGGYGYDKRVFVEFTDEI
ncbi:MAG: hypothetical protein IKJ77_06950 [Firmicutes bacterium]|nr:hypothetical protein [Bacillota bacterium]